MWMPAQTTMPPLRTAARARGTSSPAGAKMITLSSSTGGGWSDPLTDAAPSSDAKRRDSSPRVTTWTSCPRCSATWITMCADAPNPYRPSRGADP